MTDPKETWVPNIVFALASLVFIKTFEFYMKNLVECLVMNHVGSGPNCFKYLEKKIWGPTGYFQRHKRQLGNQLPGQI